MSTKRTNKKMLAARILCTLLLGTYLTGGYSGPVQAAGSVNGNEHVEITGSYASAWGYGDTYHPVKATGNYSTAFGVGTEAGGEGSTAFGNYSRAVVFNSTAWGYATQAGQLLYGSNNTAADIVSYVEGGTTIYNIVDAKNPDKVLKGGFNSYYSAYHDDDLQHKGYGATAFGYMTTAIGDNSTAFGYESKASGDNSMAFGKFSNAKADNSLAALGGYVDESAKNSAAIGNGAKVTVADAVALGSGSVADTADTISVGSSSLQRKIVNVAAGTADTDAVNLKQLSDKLDKTEFNTYKEETAWTISTMNGAIAGLDGRVTDAEKAIQNNIEVTIPVIQQDISDLKTGKLDKAEFNTYKEETAVTISTMNGAIAGLDGRVTDAEKAIDNFVDTKANADMDNLTETGKTAVKDLAKGAINVVGDGPVSVAKSDVSGVDTYTVSVKTDGKVEDSNTGIVTGGTVYDYLHGDTVELGKGSKATGTQSIAIGFGNKVSGNNSGAIGDPNTVEGDNSWAFGNNNQIPGSNSIVLGNNNNVSGSNTFVLGSNITADVDDAVVLGDGSKAEAGAVSVGAEGKERQIKHVADGTDDTDAATVGQLKALAGGTGAGLEEVTRRISNVDSKVNKVGAGAAALAALHPMDTDGKFSMAAGFGNYRDANAMALGLFYRPNDRVMFSMGGSLGNGENLLNVGVSFALDKGVTTSKAAMARKINALEEQNSAILEENKAIRAENAEQKAEIQELKEALARIEAKLAK